MGLTGKYDLKGFQKAGRVGLKAALASSSFGAALTKLGMSSIIGWVGEVASNWAANKGLVILNLGANYVNGELDQKAFDKAIDEGLLRLEQGQVTQSEGEAIDETVRKAARRFIPWGK